MLPISKESLQTLLYIWAGLGFILLLATWYSKRPGVGLPLCYVFSTSLIHVPGAIAHAMPDYQPRAQVLIDNQYSLKATQLGFEVTTIGLLGFVLAWFFATPCIGTKVRLHALRIMPVINSKLPGTLLVMSLLFFFVLFPVMKMIPSMGSIGSSGVSLSMVAVCAACWHAWTSGDRVRFYWWLIGSSIAFPFTTLIFMGFMSFGTASAITVWMFVMSFYRPRWMAVVVLFLFMYGGMSLYINYMRERSSIRESVWGEQKLSSRFDQMTKIITNFELLDVTNNYHLEALDGRLNQNHLLGMSVAYIGRGRVDFSQGYTLWVAATAWIPRVLWPNKPSMAGSSGMVAHFTGMTFAQGTSVGIGHIMELYINYGRWCVFIGLFVIGFLLRWFDLRAGQYLVAGDYWSFGRWMLPATALLNIGSNIATSVASMAAAFVFVTAIHRVFFASYYTTSAVAAPSRVAALARPWAMRRGSSRRI
jgi:hypothetical protein